jgi:hypothetical protein
MHPTLEAALHILNADLPSAHFLVRHMQAPPAVEGMLLHAILHRCEGDIENARAWAGDVKDACEGWIPKKRGVERLDTDVAQSCNGDNGCENVDAEKSLVEFVYGQGDGMEGLITDIERVRRRKGSGAGSEEEMELEERIRKELERVLEWCKKKFGDGAWIDASQAWVRHSEEERQKAENMVTGDQGWRKF